jgi:hypothetical protein
MRCASVLLLIMVFTEVGGELKEGAEQLVEVRQRRAGVQAVLDLRQDRAQRADAQQTHQVGRVGRLAPQVAAQRLADARAQRSAAREREDRTMYLADLMHRTAREVRGVLRAETPTHGHLRDRLVGVGTVTVVLDLVCAALALLFEHGAKGTQVANFGDALFWTSTQMLTVSSSLANPLTVGGKVLDVAMEAYAVTIVATLAGSMGSFMIRRAREIEEADRRGHRV